MVCREEGEPWKQMMEEYFFQMARRENKREAGVSIYSFRTAWKQEHALRNFVLHVFNLIVVRTK